MRRGFGGWYQVSQREELYEFIYYFEINGAQEQYANHLLSHKDEFNKIIRQVARQTLIYLPRMSTKHVRNPLRIHIVFTMRSAKGAIHTGAWLDICANYWLFPILTGSSEKLHLLTSSIIHEMEHAAVPDETIKTDFGEGEELATFVEWLAIPTGVEGRHETEYLPLMKHHLQSGEKRRNFAHAQAFYMTLLIFLDFIIDKHPFVNYADIRDFPHFYLDAQFETLQNLRKRLRADKKEFLDCASQVRSQIHHLANQQAFIDRFRKAEERLNLKKKLDLRN